jgi:hypothetical protein
MKRLLLASVVSLSMIGRDAGGCDPTGRNDVRAALSGTANVAGRILRVGGRASDSTPRCRSLVRGWIEDAGGAASIELDCSDPMWADRAAVIDLPDPRSLIGTSSSRLTIFRSGVAGMGDRQILSATVDVLEAKGAAAPIPKAVTDDFVRHLRITASIDETEVLLDVVLTAGDLRQPEQVCGG